MGREQRYDFLINRHLISGTSKYIEVQKENSTSLNCWKNERNVTFFCKWGKI